MLYMKKNRMVGFISGFSVDARLKTANSIEATWLLKKPPVGGSFFVPYVISMLIYHNVALRAPATPAQDDFNAKPMKTAAYQAKNPQNGTDES